MRANPHPHPQPHIQTSDRRHGDLGARTDHRLVHQSGARLSNTGRGLPLETYSMTRGVGHRWTPTPGVLGFVYPAASWSTLLEVKPEEKTCIGGAVQTQKPKMNLWVQRYPRLHHLGLKILTLHYFGLSCKRMLGMCLAAHQAMLIPPDE